MESKELALADIQTMAGAIVRSGLFAQIKDVNQAVTLMLLCQAEGLHPIQALRQYNIIQGQPALKADAMLARFQDRGGKVKWLRMDDECCEAEFMSKGLESPVKVKFDLEDAKRAQLVGKQSWRQYPRAMLRARVISEGVRASDPAVNAGLYTVEEVQDFAPGKFSERQVDRILDPDLTPVLEASIAQVQAEKGGSEPPVAGTSSSSTPDGTADDEPPAFLYPDEHTPEEAQAIIKEYAEVQTTGPSDDLDTFDYDRHMKEKGLGQKCVKCEGIVRKFTSGRTGRVYLQCEKAHLLREDAIQAGCDEKTAKGFTKGHSYAYI